MSQEETRPNNLGATLAASLAEENAAARLLIRDITGLELTPERQWLAGPHTDPEFVAGQLGVTDNQRTRLQAALTGLHAHYAHIRDNAIGAVPAGRTRTGEAAALTRSYELETGEAELIIRDAIGGLPVGREWLRGPHTNPGLAATLLIPDNDEQRSLLETRLRLLHERFGQMRKDITNPYRVSQAAIVTNHDYSVSVNLDTDANRWGTLLQNSNIVLDAQALGSFAQSARDNIVSALSAANFSPYTISESEGRQHVVCTLSGDTANRLSDASHMVRDVVERSVRSDISALVPSPPPLAPEINAELKDLVSDYTEGARLRHLEERTAIRTLISEELGIELPDVRESPHWMGDNASARAIVGALRLDLPPEDAARANIPDAAIEKLQTELNEVRARFKMTRNEAYVSLKRESAHVKEHGLRRPDTTPSL